MFSHLYLMSLGATVTGFGFNCFYYYLTLYNWLLNTYLYLSLGTLCCWLHSLHCSPYLHSPRLFLESYRCNSQAFSLFEASYLHSLQNCWHLLKCSIVLFIISFTNLMAIYQFKVYLLLFIHFRPNLNHQMNCLF